MAIVTSWGWPGHHPAPVRKQRGECGDKSDLDRKITGVCECKLLEMPLPGGDRCERISDYELAVRLEPFEIETFRLQVGPFVRQVWEKNELKNDF